MPGGVRWCVGAATFFMMAGTAWGHFWPTRILPHIPHLCFSPRGVFCIPQESQDSTTMQQHQHPASAPFSSYDPGEKYEKMHSIKRRKAALDGALLVWMPSSNVLPVLCVTLRRPSDPSSSSSGLMKMQSISERLHDAHVCMKFRVFEHRYTVA